MNVMYDRDANREVLNGKRIAIIGFGSQGHAHAQNLHDSGYDVVVGLRPDSRSRAAAEAAGLPVATVPEAVKSADLVMILAPDEVQPQLYENDIAPNLKPGVYLAFAHGFGVHFGRITPPADANVFLAAPKGPGHLVRRQYAAGSGVPTLIAIHQDPAGNTRDVALAYAAGIGGGRAGIIETSFREETETDLFGEQAVLCGGLSELIRAGFETLVAAGYAPEMAYFECLHEVKLITDLIYERGITGMRDSISNTAEYGDITRGKRIVTDATRAAMRQILAEIQSGQFADEWMEECAAGKPNMSKQAAEEANHAIEVTGARLRSMMPTLTAGAQRPAAPNPAPAARSAPAPRPAASNETTVRRTPSTPAAAKPAHTTPTARQSLNSGPEVEDASHGWPGFEAPPCWYLQSRAQRDIV